MTGTIAALVAGTFQAIVLVVEAVAIVVRKWLGGERRGFEALGS